MILRLIPRGAGGTLLELADVSDTMLVTAQGAAELDTVDSSFCVGGRPAWPRLDAGSSIDDVEFAGNFSFSFSRSLKSHCNRPSNL